MCSPLIAYPIFRPASNLTGVSLKLATRTVKGPSDFTYAIPWAMSVFRFVYNSSAGSKINVPDLRQPTSTLASMFIGMIVRFTTRERNLMTSWLFASIYVALVVAQRSDCVRSAFVWVLTRNF